jgi:hypothetical protein
MKYLNLAFDECPEVYPPKPASVFFAESAIQVAKKKAKKSSMLVQVAASSV